MITTYSKGNGRPGYSTHLFCFRHGDYFPIAPSRIFRQQFHVKDKPAIGTFSARGPYMLRKIYVSATPWAARNEGW